MGNRFLRWLEELREERELTKTQSCCVCKYFDWYMGSAGICTSPTRIGCPVTRMVDCSDTCNCGCFKKKRGKK